MSNNNVTEGTTVPFVETADNGRMEIVPVNQGDLEEITPGQMALGLGVTALVGYGIGKLGELLYNKVILPGYVKAVDKIEENRKKKNKKLRRKAKRNETIIEAEEAEDDNLEALEEEELEYEDDEETEEEPRQVSKKAAKKAAKKKKRH